MHRWQAEGNGWWEVADTMKTMPATTLAAIIEVAEAAAKTAVMMMATTMIAVMMVAVQQQLQWRLQSRGSSSSGSSDYDSVTIVHCSLWVVRCLLLTTCHQCNG